MSPNRLLGCSNAARLPRLGKAPGGRLSPDTRSSHRYHRPVPFTEEQLHRIVAAAHRVGDHVRAVCETWRFPSNANHAAATSALARSSELVEEALFLSDGRTSPGANILVRSAFENWLVGNWALFGGEDALIGIERERARYERVLAERNGLPPDAVDRLNRQIDGLADVANRVLGTNVPSSVKYTEIAKALPPLVKQQTRDHEDADFLAVYDVFYRSHSTYDAHPWKTIGSYLAETGLGLAVRTLPPWQDPRASAAHMATYNALLGRWIEQARGSSGDEWTAVVDPLADLLSKS